MTDRKNIHHCRIHLSLCSESKMFIQHTFQQIFFFNYKLDIFKFILLPIINFSFLDVSLDFKNEKYVLVY